MHPRSIDPTAGPLVACLLGLLAAGACATTTQRIQTLEQQRDAPALIALLVPGEQPEEVLEKAKAALRRLGAEAIPAARRSLADPRYDERWRGAIALGAIQVPAVVPILRDHFAGEVNELVRVAVMLALGDATPTGEPLMADAVPVVQVALADPHPDVRTAAVTLAAISRTAALEARLAPMAEHDPDAAVRARATLALAIMALRSKEEASAAAGAGAGGRP